MRNGGKKPAVPSSKRSGGGRRNRSRSRHRSRSRSRSRSSSRGRRSRHRRHSSSSSSSRSRSSSRSSSRSRSRSRTRSRSPSHRGSSHHRHSSHSSRRGRASVQIVYHSSAARDYAHKVCSCVRHQAQLECDEQQVSLSEFPSFIARAEESRLVLYVLSMNEEDARRGTVTQSFLRKSIGGQTETFPNIPYDMAAKRIALQDAEYRRYNAQLQRFVQQQQQQGLSAMMQPTQQPQPAVAGTASSAAAPQMMMAPAGQQPPQQQGAAPRMQPQVTYMRPQYYSVPAPGQQPMPLQQPPQPSQAPAQTQTQQQPAYGLPSRLPSAPSYSMPMYAGQGQQAQPHPQQPPQQPQQQYTYISAAQQQQQQHQQGQQTQPQQGQYVPMPGIQYGGASMTLPQQPPQRVMQYGVPPPQSQPSQPAAHQTIQDFLRTVRGTDAKKM